MRAAVLDASVVLLWYAHEPSDEAEDLRARQRAGTLDVLAPNLLFLEAINVAARRWGWTADAVEELARGLAELGFTLAEPSLPAVARWTAPGLSAYDACYVALAEEQSIPLVTADAQILAAAPAIARPLA